MNDEHELTLLDVPRWTECSRGGWKRCWKLVLERPASSEAISAIELMSTPQLRARATFSHQAPCEIELETYVESDPDTDENFLFSAYRLFQRIDAEVVSIATIQGTPRDKWAPFRAGRNNPRSS